MTKEPIEYKTLPVNLFGRSFSGVNLGDSVIIRPFDMAFLGPEHCHLQFEKIKERAEELSCGAWSLPQPDFSLVITFE